MKQEIQNPISVLDPVGKAIDEVKIILFQPFDLKKWFVIGFCAWLAHLGSGGGPNGGGPGGNGPNSEFSQNNLTAAKEFVVNNLGWIIPVACIAVVTVVLLWLVMTWLSSRGHFMFLHCISKNKAEVQVPWSQYRDHGNSLFLFRVLLGIISSVLILLSLVPGMICGVGMAKGFGGLFAIIGLAVSVLMTVSLAIAFTLIEKFTFDFVVPIMSLQTASCIAGWRAFLQIMSGRKGTFILYILFCFLIAIALGAIVMTAVLVTCCCAGIVLAIPYIGVVLMLPLLVFKRAYSLYFLSQFGSDCDVFASRVELVEPVDS